MTFSKDLKKMIEGLDALGWRVQETKSGWRFLAPDGIGSVGSHRGQADPRSMKNVEAAIRRIDPRFRPKKNRG